jgi:cytosine/adenosine deaminase-related metal-dependent hydrolase
MGTRNVAAFMGTSDTAGTIALGKRADLVLLDGNPLRDIGRVAGPAGVMVGGRWHARAELEAMLDRLATWKDFDLRAVRHTLWGPPAPSP